MFIMLKCSFGTKYRDGCVPRCAILRRTLTWTGLSFFCPLSTTLFTYLGMGWSLVDEVIGVGWRQRVVLNVYYGLWCQRLLWTVVSALSTT